MNITIREAFEAAELLKGASPASRARLLGCARLKQFECGETVFQEKQSVQTLHILICGVTALYRLDFCGEKKVMLLMREGMLLNENVLSSPNANIACEALRPCVVLTLPVRDLMEALSEDFGLAQSIFDAMNHKLGRLQRHLKNTPNAIVGEKKLAAKLYKLAMDFGVRQGADTLIDLHISITYLADMLGQRRETVSRQFKALRQMGLAKHRNHRFFIPDMQKLLAFFHGA